MKKLYTALVAIFLITAGYAQSWQSDIVYLDDNGRISYVSDEDGNYIPDFSQAGYKYGSEQIPNVPNVDTIWPLGGDNTAHIQAALDSVGALPPDANGIRGALFLMPGTYNVSSTIYIRQSGVVLRGSGRWSSTASNTHIYSTTTSQVDVIVAGGGDLYDKWRDSTSTPRQYIVSPYLPIGTQWIQIQDASAYNVGDHIVVFHPADSAWLYSVDYGAPDVDADWTASNDVNIQYKREIVDKSGNFIKINVPIFNEIDISKSHAYIYEHDEKDWLTNIGVEDLRVDNVYTSSTDENHAWNHVCFYAVRDAWADNLYVTHFGRAGILTRSACNITISNVQAKSPRSCSTCGSRRYNFAVDPHSNNILFMNLQASWARHSFISNATASGSNIVWSRAFAEEDYYSSEGHRMWSHGMLFDSLTFSAPNTTTQVLGLFNRGSYGTSHGWSASNSVAWNCNAENIDILIQEPPSGQNYGIACNAGTGNVDGNGPFLDADGYIEGTDSLPQIGSLHRMQVKQMNLYGDMPDPPARLVVADSGSYVLLSWLDIDQEESGYYIERSLDGGTTYSLLDTIAANSSSYADTVTFLGSNTVHYRVRAYNSNTYSAYSNPSYVIFSCGTVEHCGNGIDDDGDGLIDCQDPDCFEFNSFTSIGNYTPFATIIGQVGTTATYEEFAKVGSSIDLDLRGTVVQKSGNASGYFEFHGTSSSTPVVHVINDNTNSIGDSLFYTVKWEWLYTGTNNVYTPKRFTFNIKDIDGGSGQRDESASAWLCDLVSYLVDTNTNLNGKFINQEIRYSGTQTESGGDVSTLRLTYTDLGTFYTTFGNTKVGGSQDAGFSIDFKNPVMTYCEVDGGDAPISYMEDSMTFHRTIPTLFLGDTVDQDMWAVTSSGSNKDDNEDSDDEDAFATDPPDAINASYSLNGIPVSNNTDTVAFLAGWIDDNCNGVFDDWEMQVDTIASGGNSANLAWTLTYPTNCSSLFMRLRLSTNYSQVSRPNGFAVDGEMEDYVILSGQTLPIRLVTLDAEAINNDHVNVSWVTAVEINTDYYIVEASGDGNLWHEVGEVAAAGNSFNMLQYELTDYYPVNGTNYYRLIQVDEDGGRTAFGPVSADIIRSSIYSLYPNPASDFTTIMVDASGKQNIHAEVINSLGAKVKFIELNESKTEISLSDLPAGAYIVKLYTDEQVLESLQLIKN